ncbi:hypothetical protein BDU57DRAFT_514751 [Ampelomyces quisqualis]|uniref:Rhodopsin domain-containing protein n=1 Tax=Ampelomyces quisqualis TaxID=50730 RepID=A0A6A5QQX9_AMPQU|nr:hypothetical protein BDU57DRAFT_514751 [Ampelomyces quisqualis]
MAATKQLSPEQLAALAKDDLSELTKNIIIAFTVISFVSVCLRLYTRVRYKAVGWEDYSIALAMVCTITTGVCQVLQANAGNGKHAVFVAFPEGVEIILKYLFWSIIAYNISLTCIKVSIILQYKRIFTLREMRIPLHIAMGICVAWGITTFFTSIFACVPVNAFWHVLEKANAKCLKHETLWFINAAINIFTDLMLAILPVKAIWGLQIHKRQKIALVGILTIGWFVCVVSTLRLNALVVLSKNPADQTYYSAAAAYWSAIELNLGIVCASLPALRPLVVKLIPGFSTRNSSKSYGAGISAHKSRGYGPGSKATRSTTDGEVNVKMESINGNAYSSRANQDKKIYVTQRIEQHCERNGQSSDSESQKDLVTHDAFPSPYCLCAHTSENTRVL